MIGPTLVFATDTFWSFTSTRLSNSNTAGIYWNHSTSSEGDLEVDAAVVDNNGNVIEKATFDENGELKSGVITNGSESLAEYIESTEGTSGSETSGFYGSDDPFGCLGLHCNSDDPFNSTFTSTGSL